MNPTDTILPANPPMIVGLSFRHFRGVEDYPRMIAVIQASAEADKIERVDTVEDVAHVYSHLVNSDPDQDMIFVEMNHEVIGYGRGFWRKEENGPHVYGSVGFLMPAWRRKGIGQTMLDWLENRLRILAETQAALETGFLEGFSNQETAGIAAMFETNGYKPVRYFVTMVRPDFENIPDYPLPEGLEVRPVMPEHYRLIWEADTEAFRDHWGYSPPTEEDYQAWLGDRTIFQPDLWQIAWDTNTTEIAGQVRTFVNAAENEKYNRKRGYTEFISVRRPWRKRGLARALIVRSLRLQRDLGMTESTLGADSENLTGATRVYEDCGFRVTKRNTLYRKPIQSEVQDR